MKGLTVAEMIDIFDSNWGCATSSNLFNLSSSIKERSFVNLVYNLSNLNAISLHIGQNAFYAHIAKSTAAHNRVQTSLNKPEEQRPLEYWQQFISYSGLFIWHMSHENIEFSQLF